MRAIFAAKGDHGRQLLAGWLAWANRSRLTPFVKLAKTVEHHKPLIINTLVHELSNARSEATNTPLRTLTRRAYGFHTPEALIGTAMLTRAGAAHPYRAGTDPRKQQNSQKQPQSQLSGFALFPNPPRGGEAAGVARGAF